MGCVSGCPQLVPIGTRTIRHVIKAMYVCMLLTKNNVKRPIITASYYRVFGPSK